MAESAKELKEILKLSTSIGKAYSDLSDLSDKRNKSLKKESDTQKGIVTGVNDEASARKAILRLQERHIASANKNYGVNKSIGAQLNATNKGAQGALKTEVNKYNILGKVNKITNSISDGIENGLGSLQGSLREVPVIGKAMEGLIPFDKLKGGVARLGNAFKGGFKGAFSSANIQSKGFVKAFGGGLKSGFGGMAKAAARLGPALAGPQGIVVAIVAVLALGVIAMYRLEKAGRAFRNETGLLNSQMGDVETTINSVYMETAGLGASMEDVAKNAAAFVNEFGGIEKPSENVVKSLTVMNKNFGVAVGDAVKVNKAFQNMGGLSADVAQANAESVVSLAKAEGVAPRKVMADIADSAEEAQGFFRGNIQALGAAAINAAKMGSSLKEAAKVSRGLLNYQDSVSNEMEASAILGTNLNFSQSRYLAATGDVVGAQASMVKQLRNRVDLDKASVFEIEAMEKATGMQFAQIQNMARLQKLNLGLDKEQNALLQKAIKGGLDIKNMSADDIKAKTEALALQQETQGRLESMGNAMKKFGSTILQAFLPIGEGLISIIEPIFSLIKFTTKFSITQIKMLGEQFKNIMNILKGIFTLDMSLIGDSLIDFFMFPINYLREMFPKTMEYIGGLVTGIKDKFMKMIPKETLDKISGSFKSMKESWEKIKGSLAKSFEKIKTAFLPVKEAWVKIFGESKSTLFDTMGKVFGFIANVVGKVIGKVFEVIASTIGNVAKVFSNIAGFLNGDIGLGEALMGIGTALLDQIMTIPNLLWDGITAMFSGFGSFLSGMIRSAVGDTAADFMGLDKPTTPTVNDGIVKNRQIVSTHPDDYLIATKDPGGLASAMSGGGMDMSGVIAELKELKAAFVANKDVYIDNEKITSRISKTQEKSNINQFGIMGA